MNHSPLPPEQTSPMVPPNSLAIHVIFIGFAAAAIIATLALRDLSAQQEFFLRVFTAIGAAGVAGMVPGFLGLHMKFVKAGGALGVFALIFLYNPPRIEKRADAKSEFGGKWHYSVHPSSEKLGYRSPHYGGEAAITPVDNPYGTHLSMTGSQNWHVAVDEQGVKTLERVTDARAWTTSDAAISDDDQIVYRYEAVDFGRAIEGYCRFKILRNADGEVIELAGYFDRTGADAGIRGTISLTRTESSPQELAKRYGAEVGESFR